ncbi:acyl-CoA dehydrogenase family protein [Nocardioides daeguensis]|uniref:Acyl-CoA dehydrogenase family protein n=2 Tax=Nocardioides daeguensis TaxID=908359 RepID=A0ABP6VV86_9ACTN|nr:acyl-CoA dehydrogenase family protein [Nocardioides daeguensis]MCR1772460.1 acyl-CoA dehydrogenase family protein [Nocardioides daeguensis]
MYDPKITAAATEDFVREVVLPLDDRHDGDIEAAGGDRLRIELQAAARQRGIFAPHAPVEFGGGGLSMVDRAAVFEEAGYSLFGPLALNIAAPDEGNMHLLDHVGTSAQREEFLAPLVRGEVRSGFAMTEPSPGAGSDPSALTTVASRVADGWLINGRKRFITGADGASFFIVMARTSGTPGEHGHGATMFLVPATTEGLDVGRHMHTQDKSMVGGHCEMTFTNVLVPDSAILGERDLGFRYAQVRLGPARMTHVMRWLGAARRAHETAVVVASERRAFGDRLVDLGMVQQMIADNEIDLAATRALLLKACVVLDDGGRGSEETSVAKIFAAEALCRIADRAQQMCGGLGVSAELPVSRIARELRPFRIYDGPSEVHRYSIANRAVRRITEAK